LRVLPWALGWVAERFKAPVLKTGDVQASVGSNPTPSASRIRRIDIQLAFTLQM
jgi:hypothetical protein